MLCVFSISLFSITTVLREAFLEILASPPKSRSLNGNLEKTHPVNVTGEVNKSDTVASLGSSEFPPGFGGFGGKNCAQQELGRKNWKSWVCNLSIFVLVGWVFSHHFDGLKMMVIHLFLGTYSKPGNLIPFMIMMGKSWLLRGLCVCWVCFFFIHN